MHKSRYGPVTVMAVQTSPTDITDVIFGTGSQSVYAENNIGSIIIPYTTFACVWLYWLFSFHVYSVSSAERCPGGR